MKNNSNISCIRMAFVATVILAVLQPVENYMLVPTNRNYRGSILMLAGRIRPQKLLDTRKYLIDSKGYFADDDNNMEFILAEFPKVLESMTVYKKIFGDLDIPLKFDIPDESPWPLHLHGLRLGKNLEKLLSSEEFLTEHQDKVQQLSKLGFYPVVKSLKDDFALIYDGLRVYKELNGDLRVPAKFVIPDETPWPRNSRGLKLGLRIAAMRSAGRYVKDHPDRKAMLDDLGFEWRVREHTYRQQESDVLFDTICLALESYKKQIGGVNSIPGDFVVPSDKEKGFPEPTWGLQLGNYVQAIKDKDKLVFGHEDRERRLVKIGLDLSPGDDTTKQVQNKRFEIILEALKIYRSIFGDLVVPHTFVVPSEAPWPYATWDLKLGTRVAAIRNQASLSPQRREVLQSIGFVFELPNQTKRKKKKAAEAQMLSESVEQYVSQDQSSSLSDLFASKSFGRDQREQQGESIESLDFPEMGFHLPGEDFDPTYMFEPDSFREVSSEAMREYMQAREYSLDPDIRQWAHFEGNMTPETFNKVVARQIPQADIDAMKRLGHRVLELDGWRFETVVNALKIYKQEFGDVNVPRDYVIDEEVILSGIGFDEQFEDLRLGAAVEAIRIGDADGLEDPPRRAILDDLGFEWGDLKNYQRVRFWPLLLGLRIYKHLYSYPLPRYNFVVPDGPQWPYWMAHMPLGEWSSALRVQQKMMQEFYPERVRILNNLEYIWQLPPGPIPTKYYEEVVV